ncbi:MAG: SPFH domain-containing protein [Planctomycetota bacterium]
MMLRDAVVLFRRVLIVAAVLAGVSLILLAVVWNAVFRYVEPESMLIVISKNGDPPPPDQILAKAGQKGIQEEVLGEGRHFVWPVLYETEAKPALRIPAGKIGVVTAKVGRPLPPGKILADEGEKGIRRRVLPPGLHRLNPYGYDVQVAPAMKIGPGYVGIVTSKVGTPPPPGERFAKAGERGVRADVLPPGIYYINPHELQVDVVEIGIRQTSFFADESGAAGPSPPPAAPRGAAAYRIGHPLQFPSADGFPILLNATVEWEILPEHGPSALLEFGDMDKIEDRVLVPQSNSIGRLQGSNYAAKEFLLGAGRERFQQTFTDELTRTCAGKWVTVHSAFLRTIQIPLALLRPIQESFIAVEMRKTAAVQEETKKSAAELQRQQSLIQQRMLEVQSEILAIVKRIAAEAEASVANIDAATRLAVAAKQQEIAAVEAERTKVVGKAEADVVELVGRARAESARLQVEAFGRDAAACARYAFTMGLPESLRIRLVQSGPGTLWTDLKGTAGAAELGGMRILQGTPPAPEPAPAP